MYVANKYHRLLEINIKLTTINFRKVMLLILREDKETTF